MVAPDEGCLGGVSAFDPLLRSAVGFVRRGPAWSIAIALAVGSFAAARATAPLVTDAAADRSFAAEAALAASSARLGQGLDARAFTSGLTDVAALEAVSGELADLPVYEPSVVTVSPLLPYTDERDPVPLIRTVDGARQATAIVFARGETSDSLRPAASAAGDDDATDGAIWIPDTVAAELGVGPGDEVELALEYAVPSDAESDLSTTTTVAGVYVTSDGLPVSDDVDWSALQAPRDPMAPGRTANLLLTDAGYGDVPAGGHRRHDVRCVGPRMARPGVVGAGSHRRRSHEATRRPVGQLPDRWSANGSPTPAPTRSCSRQASDRSCSEPKRPPTRWSRWCRRSPSPVRS